MRTTNTITRPTARNAPMLTERMALALTLLKGSHREKGELLGVPLHTVRAAIHGLKGKQIALNAADYLIREGRLSLEEATDIEVVKAALRDLMFVECTPLAYLAEELSCSRQGVHLFLKEERGETTNWQLFISLVERGML